MTHKPTSIIGIDPGSAGAAVCLLPNSNETSFIDFKTSTPVEVARWLENVKHNFEIRIIMIEKVSSIPGASANSNFKFGWNVGGINWLTESMGVGIDHITPRKWQQYLGCKKSSKDPANALKKEISALISRLYPQSEMRGPRGGLLDGRSDALAIAHYARHKWRTL